MLYNLIQQLIKVIINVERNNMYLLLNAPPHAL